MNIQRFETRRQVVEAAQLTADADWEAIAEWCGGEYQPEIAGATYAYIEVPNDEEARVNSWIVRWDADTVGSYADEDFSDKFQSVTELEGVAREIRQTLEDTTPGPWKWEEDGGCMWLVGFDDADVLHGDQYECLHMTQADGELIAAAPGLLARAAERIEALEAWKESATRILGAWDEVWITLGRPGPLGTSKAVASLAAIAKEGA